MSAITPQHFEGSTSAYPQLFQEIGPQLVIRTSATTIFFCNPQLFQEILLRSCILRFRKPQLFFSSPKLYQGMLLRNCIFALAKPWLKS
jgi:hypothetical protein